MALLKGGFQRLLQTFLYFLCFLCSGIILGVYSYFLSVLADRNLAIAEKWKAVEGISGVAVVYTILAVCLTCCLGGIALLSIIAIILDILFVAGMIAIAIITRDGAHSCSGTVQTPIGSGLARADNGFGNDEATYAVHLGLACRLNTASFAVSIIAAFLFVCTAAMQLLLIRHHKKEKRYGPGPDNNYTKGSGKKMGFFGRSKKGKNMDNAEYGDGAAVTNGNRVSHETGYTGTTVGGPTYEGYDKTNGTTGPQGAHGGYYTAPTGTAVNNPYGYNNTTTTTTTATNY